MIGAVSLVVAATAALLQSLLESDVVLTAVIAMATVAYSLFSWRLVDSAARDRRERHAQDIAMRTNVLRGVLVELKQNHLRRGQTQAWLAFVPFERGALDEARPVRAHLPEAIAVGLHEVENRVARYNAVARYNETNVRMGTGAADSELIRLSVEADDSFVVAIQQLEAYLNSLAA